MGARPFVAAVVVAGGSGERFGAPAGKQLSLVAGRPLLSWSLEVLDRSFVDAIVVVCPQGRADEYEAVAVTPLAPRTPITFADSGASRQASVRSGLAALPDAARIVVVHDGARPLVTVELIEQLVDALVATGASGVVAAHPSIDTLKIVEDERILETPERARFWQVQTPQVFLRETLERAHARAFDEGFLGTDDASLLERMGADVRVLEAPRSNIKVTLPEDVTFVEAVITNRREGAATCE